MKLLRTGLTASLFFLAATISMAQTGGLTVVVTDEDGNPMVGATVTISNEMGFVKADSIFTDDKGRASFPVLRPGPGYVIEVTFPEYAGVRVPDVRVKISDDTRIPVTLTGQLVETETVKGHADVIDLDKGSRSTRFSENFIADLPVAGRAYQNILTLAPGVQDPDGDGNPTVNGSRSRDFQAIVGNISNVDPLTGQQMSEINPNSIEDMEVITAGAGAEFGRAQGGFANIVQKQGSNTLEGVFEFYWASSVLDGSPNGLETGVEAFEPDYDSFHPMVQVSGPVIRDKLWYRLSYERVDRESPRNVGSAIAIQEFSRSTPDALLTWQVSPRNKLAFGYRGDPYTFNNFGISTRVTPASASFREQDSEVYHLNWTAPYSPRVYVDSTLAWQDSNLKIGPETQGVQNRCITGDDSPDFLVNGLCNNLENNTISGSGPTFYDDHRQRLTLRNQTTIFGGQFWGMSHQFRVGLSVENERYFRNLTQKPTVTYLEVQDPIEDPDGDDEELTLNAYGIALATMFIPETDDVRATGTNWGIYGSDTFKPLENLSFTLGVRIDREEINSEGRSPFDPTAEFNRYKQLSASGELNLSKARNEAFTGYESIVQFTDQVVGVLCQGVPAEEFSNCALLTKESIQIQALSELSHLRRHESINIANTNISPKLSAAWSPFSNGKTALKASAGRSYNNIPLLVPLQELQPARTDLRYRVDIASGHPVPDSEITPQVNVLTVDRNLNTPYQDELTFSVERELWAETSLTLTYINRKYRDQIQDVNVNLQTGDFGKCRKATFGVTKYVEESPGVSNPTFDNTWITDLFTGEVYPDNDPGPGDGRLDDCVGESIAVSNGLSCDGLFGGGNCKTSQAADGQVDAYLINPFWGDIFLIGNFNQFDYTGYQLEIVRRQYRSWEMNGSYTWSETKGDGEDFFQELGDDPATRENEYGYQSYDQRHVVKLNAIATTPWGIRLGTSVVWQTGTPYSLLTQQISSQTSRPDSDFNRSSVTRRQNYVTGVRNDQRNPSWWDIKLKATKELKLGRGMNMQLSAEIFNLLDDATYFVYNQDAERGVQINGDNESYVNPGRYWQVGMKLAF